MSNINGLAVFLCIIIVVLLINNWFLRKVRVIKTDSLKKTIITNSGKKQIIQQSFSGNKYNSLNVKINGDDIQINSELNNGTQNINYEDIKNIIGENINDVIINGGQINVNGVDISNLIETDRKIINLNLIGNANKVEVDNGSVNITGNVNESIITTNGSVECNDVNNISTTNGSIRANVIKGNAKSTNGKVVIK